MNSFLVTKCMYYVWGCVEILPSKSVTSRLPGQDKYNSDDLYLPSAVLIAHKGQWGKTNM